MNLQEKFKYNWDREFNWFSTNNSHLVIAVSGGVDSIVLTELLYKSGLDFTLVHCNFKLRGEDSDRDETFVKSLAIKYGKPFFVKSFETAEFALNHKVSIQEAARILRYTWFKELIQEDPQLSIQKYILTAHHADDNIETLLLNFFRGTGISGLHGILPKQDTVLRPLLFASKQEILDYAHEHNLLWVEDASNASDKYSRNYLRNKLIPMLKTIYPQVEQNLLHNIQRFKETEMIFNQAISKYKKKLLVPNGNEFHIPVLLLKKQTPLSTIIFEIIKEFDFSSHQVIEVIKLMDAESGSHIDSGRYRIIKNRKWLIIAPLQVDSAAHYLIEEKNSKINFPLGEIHLKSFAAFDNKFSTDPDIVCLDYGAIKFPLLLRRAKQGDYFYPLGMQKKKKLNRFFIDQKLSVTQKENIWVIEMDKKIIWVIGLRIDNRFKILPSTKNILQINFKSI